MESGVESLAVSLLIRKPQARAQPQRGIAAKTGETQTMRTNKKQKAKKEAADVDKVMMEQAVRAREYQELARLGAEHGLFYLTGQERRKEPDFMPELFLFKGGHLTGICALAEAVVLTSYSFPNGVRQEEYFVASDTFLEKLLAGVIADVGKPDVALLIGSAWSKGPEVTTRTQLENSPRHDRVVAFGNVYLEPKKPTATYAIPFQQDDKKSKEAAALSAA